MSEVDKNEKSLDYMANRVYSRDELVELADILRKQGVLGPVPHARLVKTAKSEDVHLLYVKHMPSFMNEEKRWEEFDSIEDAIKRANELHKENSKFIWYTDFVISTGAVYDYDKSCYVKCVLDHNLGDCPYTGGF